MEARWLEDFLCLAEFGNFTRAAEARHTSQAAFSRRIQQLEAWLGSLLIDRSALPIRLTADGERFRERAGIILKQIGEARGEAGHVSAPGHLRIALPYALASSHFATWWGDWNQDGSSCVLELGNVHDMVSSLVSGGVDLLICFHNRHQPIQLDPSHYDHVVIGTQRIRPFARRDLAKGWAWPGKPSMPVPLLMYSQDVYFGRLVDLAVAAAPRALFGRRVAECDMSDVLRALALDGQGVAWLAESSVDPAQHADLIPLGGNDWAVSVEIVAFRNAVVRLPALDRVWDRLANFQPSGEFPPWRSAAE